MKENYHSLDRTGGPLDVHTSTAVRRIIPGVHRQRGPKDARRKGVARERARPLVYISLVVRHLTVGITAALEEILDIIPSVTGRHVGRERRSGSNRRGESEKRNVSELHFVVSASVRYMAFFCIRSRQDKARKYVRLYSSAVGIKNDGNQTPVTKEMIVVVGVVGDVWYLWTVVRIDRERRISLSFFLSLARIEANDENERTRMHEVKCTKAGTEKGRNGGDLLGELFSERQTSLLS